MKRYRLTFPLLVIAGALFTWKSHRRAMMPRPGAIPVAPVYPCTASEAFEKLGDDRQIIVRSLQSGDYLFNETRVARQDAAHQIDLIYSTRNDRLVWFIADPGRTYGQAIESLALLNTTGNDVRVALPTPSQIASAQQQVGGNVTQYCPR